MAFTQKKEIRVTSIYEGSGMAEEIRKHEAKYYGISIQ